MRLTKKQVWQSMDRQTKDFVRAMTKAGLTIKQIEVKSGVWRKGNEDG